MVYNSPAAVQRQANILEKRLWNQAKAAKETKAPLPVLKVYQINVSSAIQKKYRRAQRNAMKRYAMATSVTTNGLSEIEGRRTQVSVIDTGASTITLGSIFAARLDECQVW